MEYIAINTKKYINNGIYFHFMEIDQKDKKILKILKQDSKLTTNMISKKINLPITTIHNRIKKLQKQGIIISYTVKIDYKKIGRPIKGYLLVNVTYSLPNGGEVEQEEIAKKIRELDCVEEVNIVTGGTDILVCIRVKDIGELNDFITKKIRNIKGVDKTQTLIVLNSF